ncbi:hypothetical protein NDU88_002061 [Pleurodeles waltl]|uniref:Reverse transcriptase domain-containing protein n=1 Tax=Pleurodeles waltl TaxID=8319 RepID=A0AAV7VYB5_PLEWA|nr:hypothetical protein NDU88_002061 [Pleurodeles waltl]
MNTIHSGSPYDPCTHHILNKASSIIAPQLRKIISSSFESATFSESWKHAEINAPLKKSKTDRKDLKNFRPIALLPFPSKFIEKAVNRQLTRFLKENCTLDPSQSGFRSNHSTEIALITATDYIRTIPDKDETSALIFLDLLAAFDTICHHTLRSRLSNAGIHDRALDWVTSFLTGRTQIVCLPPFRSEATKIICAVPQGSFLSPTLSNIYMALLANITGSHNLNIISYADDTQLILSLTKDSAKTNLQEEMKDIVEWMPQTQF